MSLGQTPVPPEKVETKPEQLTRNLEHRIFHSRIRSTLTPEL